MTDTPRTLPVSLHRFFWDVDPKTVDPSKSSKYVINRLLDKGDLAAARWVLRHFPKSLIVDTFKTMRDFSPRAGYFWSRYLNISQEEVACLRLSYRIARATHWPY